MASYVKRGEVWYVKFYDHAGEQKWVRGFSDKRQTEALGNKLEAEKHSIRRGDVDPKNEQRKIERAKPVTMHVEMYRDALTAKGDDSNHVAYTIADINRFIAFADVLHAAAIDRSMVDRWVLSLKKPQTIKLKRNKTKIYTPSNRTINRHVRSLQGFLRHLQSNGTLTEYPLLGYPQLKTKGHEKRRRRPLSIDEQAKLLTHSDTRQDERSDVYRFALLTGARLNQLQKLRVRDVNFEQSTISLSAKDASHSNKVHMIPLHPQLVTILKKRIKMKLRDAIVFTDAPTKDNAADWVREDCTAAGIDTTDIDFYALRHTFGSTLAAKGVHPKVLQTLMGHADIETTLEYYTHFRREDEYKAMQLLTA